MKLEATKRLQLTPDQRVALEVVAALQDIDPSVQRYVVQELQGLGLVQVADATHAPLTRLILTNSGAAVLEGQDVEHVSDPATDPEMIARALAARDKREAEGLAEAKERLERDNFAVSLRYMGHDERRIAIDKARREGRWVPGG